MTKTFKKLLYFTALITLMLAGKKNFAQLNYQPGGFVTNITTYTDISSIGTAIAVANRDDAFSPVLPIGFTFNLNGFPNDSFVFSTNGFIKLGRDSASRHFLFTTFAQPPANGPFSAATSPAPLARDSSMIFAFGQDLIADSAVVNPFTYHTDGTVGSRVCTIQWKNVKDKLQNTVGGLWDTINFQVKLYESSNVIEIIYGSWTSTVSLAAARFSAVGIVGTNLTVANQNLHLVKGSTAGWGAAVANTGFYANNAINYRNPTSTPAGPAPELGRRYSFTPVVFNDASVRVVYAQGRIALPFFQPDSIRANISNPGVNALTSLVVTLNITGVNTYTATATISSLAPNANVNVSFPPFMPTNNGNSLITVSVPFDDNTANNAATYGMSVGNNRLSYTDTTQGVTGSNGSTNPNFWGARFFVNGTGIVTTIRSFLVANSEALGDTVCGMVLDSTGLILGRSPSRVVQMSDLGSTMVFNITAPPVVTNRTVITGIAGGISTDGLVYFLGTSQAENPGRSNPTFYNMLQATPGGLTNANVGLIYANPTIWNLTRLMVECSISPLPQVDIGINAVSPATQVRIPVGVATPLIAVVRNNGQQSRSAGMQVRYQIGSGAIVGPVSTTAAIAAGDTTSVRFFGTNALNFGSAGVYTVRVFTSLTGDSLIGNDTFTITYNASPGVTIPANFDNDIFASWGVQNPTNPLLKYRSVVQANGIIDANVLWADNLISATTEARIFSPLFNFTGLANPVLNFHVAHGPNTFTGTDDTLQVLVSTNGGYSYTTLYTRSSQLSLPRLGTDTITSASYQPNFANDWRYETVNLAQFAGQPSVLISFRNRAMGGNGIYIGNISVTNASSVSEQSVFTTGVFTSSNASITFTTIGLAQGEIALIKRAGTPFTNASPVYASNTSALTNNASIFTPSQVSPIEWFTITYSGIGTGNPPQTAQYIFSMDLTGLPGATIRDSLYIMRRINRTTPWTAVNTTISGNILSTDLLTGFSDFALGSIITTNALPVKWLSLNATKLDENANELNWKTASEENNQYFEVEHSLNGKTFEAVGKIESGGNASTVSSYSFVHKNTKETPQVDYYRIKQVDIDGAMSYSPTLKLTPTTEIYDMSIQNPFDGTLNLSLNSFTDNTALAVKITDITGHLRAETNYILSKGAQQLSLHEGENLIPGIYFIQYKIGESEWKTKKLIKL